MAPNCYYSKLEMKSELKKYDVPLKAIKNIVKFCTCPTSKFMQSVYVEFRRIFAEIHLPHCWFYLPWANR